MPLHQWQFRLVESFRKPSVSGSTRLRAVVQGLVQVLMLLVLQWPATPSPELFIVIERRVGLSHDPQLFRVLSESESSTNNFGSRPQTLHAPPWYPYVQTSDLNLKPSISNSTNDEKLPELECFCKSTRPQTARL